jgi:hypothetical protein
MIEFLFIYAFALGCLIMLATLGSIFVKGLDK